MTDSHDCSICHWFDPRTQEIAAINKELAFLPKSLKAELVPSWAPTRCKRFPVWAEVHPSHYCGECRSKETEA